MLQVLQVHTLEMLQHLKIAPLYSSGSSIGSHVLEVTEQLSRPTQSVEDLLKAHSLDHAIWGDHVTCQLTQQTAKKS